MLVKLPPMRPMDIDPTFVPYLESVVAGRRIPISEDDVVKRRERMAKLRRENAPPPPEDVLIGNTRVAAGEHEIPVRTYRPTGHGGPRPCVLYIHGGGWMYGSAEQSDPVAIRYCRETGAVVLSPDYRLSPEHPFPAGFQDCWRTLEWVVQEASSLGVDARRVAVAGESSGANLAAACAIEARDRGAPALALQLLLYPALGTDFDSASYRENAAAPVLSREEMVYFWTAYLAGDLGIRDPRAVPLASTDLSSLAAAFIVTGEYDPLRDDGAAYARRLADAGCSVQYINAPRLPHGFIRGWSVSDDVKAIGEQACTALRRALA